MKVLIIKTSSLGDIVQSFPVLHYLRRIYSQAQIDWIVEKPFLELVQAHPYIHQVFSIETRKWRKRMFHPQTLREIKWFRQHLRNHSYDIVIDLQGNIKSGLLTAMAKSPLKVGFGYASVPEWPNILFTNRRYNPPKNKNIREDYLFLVQSLCGDFRAETTGMTLNITGQEQAQLQAILSHPVLHHRPCMMVCPGSNWSNKQLPSSVLKDFLKQIEHHLQASFLFVWGSASERQVVEELGQIFLHSLVVDKLSLPLLQNLMAQVQLVIAMDSLPLHLAGTTTTPTYSIFGASSAHKYKPMGVKHQAFQGSCPFNQIFEKRCPLLRSCTSGGCIKNSESRTLFDHFLSWWESESLPSG